MTLGTNTAAHGSPWLICAEEIRGCPAKGTLLPGGLCTTESSPDQLAYPRLADAEPASTPRRRLEFALAQTQGMSGLGG